MYVYIYTYTHTDTYIHTYVDRTFGGAHRAGRDGSMYTEITSTSPGLTNSSTQGPLPSNVGGLCDDNGWCMYVCVYVCICIYDLRAQREYLHMYVCVCVYMYVYM